MKSAKDQFVEKTPSPNEALNYLRGISKTYVTVIPGAGQYVDKTFDQLDELSRTHGSEVNEILSKATNELRDTIQVRALSQALLFISFCEQKRRILIYSWSVLRMDKWMFLPQKK